MSTPTGSGQPNGQQPWAGQQQSGAHHQYQGAGQPPQYPQQQYPQQPGGFSYPAGQSAAQPAGQQSWAAQQQPGYPRHPESANQLSAGRPGPVLAAAIIAFLLAALLVIGGVVIIGASQTAGSAGNFIGVSGLGGVVVAVGVVVLLIAALLIWGGVWAVNGRSYLLLMITACVLVVLALISLIQNLSRNGDVWGPIIGVIACAAIVALLSPAGARAWFAAKRR